MSEPYSGEHQEQKTRSAGEVGTAGGGSEGGPTREVLIGEIPAADDPTTLLWTVRCTDPGHDLLGHFATREDAESARNDHLEDAHGGAMTS